MMAWMRNAMIAAAVATVVICATPGAARAQGGWVLLNAKATALVRQGSNEMYNLRYTQADSIFNEIVKLDPESPAGYFLLALVDWWRIVPFMAADNTAEVYSESFNQRITKVIEKCDVRLEKNPVDIVGLFFKASALGYRARLTTSRSFSSSSLLQWAGALGDGQEAYGIILKCQNLAPSNSDIQLGAGLYNYLGAYLPQKFPALKSMAGFLPDGDKAIGISQLRLAAEKAFYASTEARYSLLDIMANMEQNYAEALPIARSLHDQYPGNSVFYKFYARSLYEMGDLLGADTAWHDILRRVKARESGYELTYARQGLYFIGNVRLRTGDLPIALRTFDEAIRISERFGDDESGWLVLAKLKRGNVLDKLGRRKEAIEMYEEVLDYPDRGESHKLASHYIEKSYGS